MKHTITWHGGSDAKTAPTYFAFNAVESHDSDGGQARQLAAVTVELVQLTADGAVMLLCTIAGDRRGLIAYRFTSDRAHDRHYSRLLGLGGGLGRGAFEPFGRGEADMYFFNEWFVAKPYEQAGSPHRRSPRAEPDPEPDSVADYTDDSDRDRGRQ